MLSSKTLIAGLVGAVVAFVLGYLTWGVLLMDYMSGQAVADIGRGDEMLWWSMILGHLIWGIGFAYVLNNWAKAGNWSSGAMAGGILGLFIGGANGFIDYGANNVMSMSGVIVDIIAMIIVSALTGAAIGVMLGMGKKAD